MIKTIDETELPQSLNLVNEIFNQFVAVDYSEQGKDTFQNYLKHKYNEVSLELNTGKSKMWGFFDNQKVIGIIAIRGKSHISLLFVDDKFHRQGIAKKLFLNALDEIKKDSSISKVTVNSSPFAIKVYERLGFFRKGELQEKDGIVFQPMEMNL